MKTTREKYYKLNFILLCLDSIFFSFTLSIFSTITVLPYFVATMTSNKLFIGLVSAIMIIGTNITQVFSSVHCVNAKNKKKFLFLSSLAQRIGLLLIVISAKYINRLPASISLAIFFFALLIFAMANGYMQPIWAEIVAGSIYKKRGKFFGIYNMIGGILGILGGYVTQNILDSNQYQNNYYIIFSIGLAVSLLSLVVIAFIKYSPEENENVCATITFKTLTKEIPQIIKENILYRDFLIARMFIAMGELAASFYIGRYIFKFPKSDGIVGQLTMVMLISQVIFSIIWGYCGDKFGYTFILKVNCIFGILAGLISLFSNNSLLFVVAFIFIGANYNGLTIATTNLSIYYSEPQMIPIYIMITNLAIVPFTGIGVIVVGYLANRFTDSIVFILSIIGYSLGLFMFEIYESSR